MVEGIKSLCKEYDKYFPIGAAVNPEVIKSHAELLVKHFNSITPENEMKPASLHISETQYSFEKADILVDFARENNMKVRGHTLVWHNQTPDWFFEDKAGGPASRELLLKRMKEHIHTVTSRYKGSVYCWDVVNEAIEDSSSLYLRKSKWLQMVGEDYIERAFEYTHESDPEALLFYNDYNEFEIEKSEKIFQLVKSLKDKNIPIHGIGMQGHWSIYGPSIEEIKRAIEKYAVLGLKLQITELDVSLYESNYKGTELKAPLSELLSKQEVYYGKIFELFREYKDVISGVTFWGAADDVSWLNYFPSRGRKNWPLLFNDEHMPKPAFYSVINK